MRKYNRHPYFSCPRYKNNIYIHIYDRNPPLSYPRRENMTGIHYTSTLNEKYDMNSPFSYPRKKKCQGFNLLLLMMRKHTLCTYSTGTKSIKEV
jgi:hypothetical protein